MKMNSKGDLLMTWIIIIGSFAVVGVLIMMGVKMAEPYLEEYNRDPRGYTKKYQERIQKQTATKRKTLAKVI